MFAGKKTYICLVVASLFSIACGMGWVDGESSEAKTILTCLFGAAGMALRHGVSKS